MHAMQGKRRVCRIQEGADIERRAGVGRDPGRIDLHELPDRLQAVVLVDARKAETVAGAVESGDIFPRAEELHTAVRAAVRVGQAVTTGTVIGSLLAGHPGCGAAACLHWGAMWGPASGARYVDPLGLLRSTPVRLKPLGG